MASRDRGRRVCPDDCAFCPLPRRRLTRLPSTSSSSPSRGWRPAPTSAKENDCSSSTAGPSGRRPRTTRPSRCACYAIDAWVRDAAVLTDADEAERRPARRRGRGRRDRRRRGVPRVSERRRHGRAPARAVAPQHPHLAGAPARQHRPAHLRGHRRRRRAGDDPRAARRRARVASAASGGRLAEAQRIVREVAAAVGLAEGERGVRAVLATLARLEPVSTRRISRAAELPVPIVAAVCGELRKRAIVAEERPTQLTPAGRELFAAGGLRIGRTAACPGCGGRGIVVPPALSPLVRELSQAVRGGPPARLELDQCHCTVDTKLRRLLAVHEAGALVGRRVLLLGDDDLTALALAAARARPRLALDDREPRGRGRRSRARRVPRARARRSAVPGACVEHDLRRPLPPELVGAFDTVLTDPPYTTAGASLFLSRAAEALDERRGDVFLSFGSRRPGAAVQLQRAIAEIGFVIQNISRDFNEYVGAGVLGGTSHLYHLAATGEPRAAVTGVVRRAALHRRLDLALERVAQVRLLGGRIRAPSGGSGSTPAARARRRRAPRRRRWGGACPRAATDGSRRRRRPSPRPSPRARCRCATSRRGGSRSSRRTGAGSRSRGRRRARSRRSRRPRGGCRGRAPGSARARARRPARCRTT